MNCCFLSTNFDFVKILADKLGSGIEFTCAEPNTVVSSADVIVFDIPVEPENREEAVSQLVRHIQNPEGVPVVAFLPMQDDQLIRTVLASGAYDYCTQMDSMDEIRIVLRRASQNYALMREVSRLRSEYSQPLFSSFASTDPKMIAACQLAAKVADSDATILITGETGTGKEVLAKAIHAASRRSNQPFVAVACPAVPETLIESELFGYEKGAFTGAIASRCGKLESAQSGTVLLDEIADLPLNLQVKLLRVLQERSFERLGSNTSRELHARVICATNGDLTSLIKGGLFRADLYYRINTITVHLPPLRDRKDDVTLLAHSFLRRFSEYHRKPVTRIRTSASMALRAYHWPGNVRQLEHVIERAVLVCDGPEISHEHLPSELILHREEDVQSVSLESEIRQYKRSIILRTLEEHAFNKVAAARALRISRASLYRMIAELGIPETQPAADTPQPERVLTIVAGKSHVA